MKFYKYIFYSCGVIRLQNCEILEWFWVARAGGWPERVAKTLIPTALPAKSGGSDILIAATTTNA